MTRLIPIITLLTFGCAHAETIAAPVPITPAPTRHLELGAVFMPGVAPLMSGLAEAAEQHETEVIVDIDSPGGSVRVGFGILEAMRDAHKAGVTITCRIDGMAASMAAVIFEAGCTNRYMTRFSSLMFHEPSVSDIAGKEWELRRVADSIADVNKRIAIVVAPHLNMTAATYANWVLDRDRWVGLDEALAMGAADGITG